MQWVIKVEGGACAVAEELSSLSKLALLCDELAEGVAFSVSTFGGFTVDSLCVIFGGTIDLPQAMVGEL